MTQWTALALTIVLEVPVVLGAARARAPEFDIPRTLAVAAAASCLTHPIVWYMISTGLPWPFVYSAALMESFAVVAESLVYWRFLEMTPRWAFLTALAANAFSFGLGLLIV